MKPNATFFLFLFLQTSSNLNILDLPNIWVFWTSSDTRLGRLACGPQACALKAATPGVRPHKGFNFASSVS